MRNGNGRRHLLTCLNTLTLIGVFMIVAAVITVPFNRASSERRMEKAVTNAKPVQHFRSTAVRPLTRILWPTSNHLTLPIVPQGGGESIATYDSTCTNPQTSFNLGDTVCAKITGSPLPDNGRAARRIGWVSPYGSLAQGADITSDPQNGFYAIPATAMQTFTDSGGGTVTVDNRGIWGVSIFSAGDASLRETAFFTVHDPAKAFVDLYISQGVTTDESMVSGGSSSVFEIFAKNFGPDAATDVVIQDTVPDNTTGQSITDHGSGFTCGAVDGGIITCTLASLPTGTEAHLTLNYSVNNGTPAGTVLTNVVDISSSATPCAPDATCEIQPNDNSSSAQATVPAAPSNATCTLDCPDNVNAVANTTENGQRGAHVTFDDAVATGTCGVVTATPASGSFFPVGSTVVNVTSETGGGSCSFIVTVDDNGTNPPTISCPANQTANADSNCSATLNIGSPTVTGDNVTFSGVRSDGQPMYNCDCFPPDPNDPTVACDIHGACTRKADAPFSAGVTTIVWTAYSHNTAGPYASPADEEAHRTGTASCTQTITVNDVTPPVIGATDQTVSADANCQAAVPDYSSTVTDNCACASSDTSDSCAGHSRIAITQDPAPGTMVGLGAHTIHITANDGSSNNNGAGNTTNKDITLTVVDTTAPVITCPGNITRSNDPGQCSAVVNPGTATATDNCDSNPTVTGTRSDNQPLNATYPVGTTTITWTATDFSGNHSSCTQTVTVNDTEPPMITCPSSQTLESTCPSGAIATWTPPVGTDNCPGAVTTRTAGPAPGSVFPIGTTTVTYTVNDAHGNSASCSFTVTVLTPQQVIQNMINTINGYANLSGTQKQGLNAKLQAALDAINQGKTNVACNKLNDFISQVTAYINNGTLTAAQGNALISSANHVRNTIGCTNNPCT